MKMQIYSSRKCNVYSYVKPKYLRKIYAIFKNNFFFFFYNSDQDFVSLKLANQNMAIDPRIAIFIMVHL